MKSQNGVTLVALTIYICIFTIVIGILTTISTFFFDNIYQVIDQPRYATEFNKFIMFFSVDVKNYNSADVTDTSIKFTDGPTYIYRNNGIYRNDELIAENVLNCTFTPNVYNVNDVAKNIINVDMQIGRKEENSLEKSIDFTLKYW